ncbi:AraC family transcriptional regulator [Streptomyces sp. NPDC090022]|uniref:AraC family transcriptional regulator n=1 Tax=Streptomyces sp. NPDC090022 TaxID=3365920 RepID=UPI00380DB1DD
MDVVSDAISAVRTGRPSSERVRVRVPVRAGAGAGGSGWCVRFGAYEGAGFHVVLEGGCRLLPDGGEPVTLGPGDAVLLPHGTGHVIADGPADAAAVARAVPFEAWRDGWAGASALPADPGAAAVEMLCGKYRLDHSRAHPLMRELPPVVHLPNRVGSHGELRSAIGLLGGELGGEPGGGPGARRPGSCVAVSSLLDLLLVYMIRSWMAEARTGSWPAALSDPVTAEALRALHSDPAAPWTNDRLAREAGVSRPTLARRFTALVGRPPMAYLTWWRLNLAAAQLRDTEAPLATIARRVGYGTPYAFSHAFTRQFGTPPSHYRARTAPG